MTKILLVEDDKSLREIYGIRLLAEGYQIASAGDGEEALAMAVKEKPDLIIADVMMPKISGFDMLDILRSTPETKDIKVIVMTALSSEDQRARGEALGANRYLVKSQVGIEDVVRTVHDVLADSPITATPIIPQFGAPAPSAITTSQPIKPSESPNAIPQPVNIAPTTTTTTTTTSSSQPNSIQIPAQVPSVIPTATPTQQYTTTSATPSDSSISIAVPIIPGAVQQPQTQPIAIPATQPAPIISTPTPITPSQLPQPTAPFSTPSLTPLSNPTMPSPTPDIGSLIEQELNKSSATPITQPPIQ